MGADAVPQKLTPLPFAITASDAIPNNPDKSKANTNSRMWL